MTDRTLDVAVFVVWLIAVIIMTFITYSQTDKVYQEPTIEVCGFSSQVEYENFKRLHSFHGTLSSWTENGNCVYKRNGQICSLWDPLTRTDR